MNMSHPQATSVAKAAKDISPKSTEKESHITNVQYYVSFFKKSILFQNSNEDILSIKKLKPNSYKRKK